jgi:SAM-dependent methyltransferase
MKLLTPHAFFEEVASRYDSQFAPSYHATEADLREIIDALPRGAVVIDLGSGTGRAWPHLVAAAAKVVGVDDSPSMHAKARRRSSANFVTAICADLYQPWPLVDGSADALIALHGVLAHPPGDAESAWRMVGAEVRRVVRPGGIIAIDVPDPAWVASHLELIQGARFRYQDERGRGLELVAPPAQVVIEALGLPLQVRTCATGLRLFGRLANSALDA